VFRGARRAVLSTHWYKRLCRGEAEARRAEEENALHTSSPPRNLMHQSMCSGSEAGSYLRHIDACITQLKAQGPSRTCNESKKEEALCRGEAEARRAEEENALHIALDQLAQARDNVRISHANTYNL